jgi:hypothetical protein
LGLAARVYQISVLPLPTVSCTRKNDRDTAGMDERLMEEVNRTA